MKILNYIFVARVSRYSANAFFINLIKENRHNFSTDRELFLKEIRACITVFKKEHYSHSKIRLKDAEIMELF